MFSIFRALLISLFILAAQYPCFAQHFNPVDFSLFCNGRLDSDSNKIILLKLNVRLGGLIIDGNLNNDPIVASNFGDDKLMRIVGYPKSQDTGNTRDIIHKMTVNINRDSGLFNLTIVGANGHSYYLSGRGQCQ